MKERSYDILKAYKKEKDGPTKVRILAVCMVLEQDKSVSETAPTLMCSQNSVHSWIAGSRGSGMDGLRDLPRSGRPTEIPKGQPGVIMERASMHDADPKTLRHDMPDATGIELGLSQVRKTMHKYGLSRRKTRPVHTSHAGAASVYSWQWYMQKFRIPRLESEGFVVAAVDGAFFVQTVQDRHAWGPVGTRSVAAYSGNRQSIAVFGCMACDGRQLFRTYAERFKSKQFTGCLEAMRSRFGKVAVICDRRSVHTSGDVAGYLLGHPDVKLTCLPRGSPYLNVVEACWNRGKGDLLGITVYKTVLEMRQKIAQYYRTAMFRNLSMYRYLFRSPVKALNYL